MIDFKQNTGWKTMISDNPQQLLWIFHSRLVIYKVHPDKNMMSQYCYHEVIILYLLCHVDYRRQRAILHYSLVIFYPVLMRT